MKFVAHSKKEAGWWNNKLGWVFGVKQATEWEAENLDEVKRKWNLPCIGVPDVEWQISSYLE